MTNTSSVRFETKAHTGTRALPWRFALAAGGFLALLGMASPAHLDIVLQAAIVGVVALLGFGLARGSERADNEAQDVVAEPGGVWFGGQVAMSRREIVRAYCGTQDGRHVVQVVGRLFRRSCTVWVTSQEEGRALIDALNLDPPTATSRFRALPPWRQHLPWLAMLVSFVPWVVAAGAGALSASTLGLIMALYAAVLVPTFPMRVCVGHDGILLEWLGNSRFVPLSSIDAVKLTAVGVILTLDDGERLAIRLTHQEGGADAEVHSLFVRIRDGIGAQREQIRSDEEAVLARSGRDVTTWLRAMRALGASEARGYRAPSIPEDRLWAVVESGAADPSAREGAALALSASLDEAGRARIVSLAQNTASPRLRVVLDGIGREREEACLGAVLASCESDSEAEDASIAVVPGRQRD